MQRLLTGFGVFSLLAAVTLIACNKSPAAPEGPAGSVAPVRLEITGPSTTPPFIETQYKAIITMANGTTRDVTAEAQWRSNSVDMRLGSPGMVTGQRNSQALLTAAHSGFTSTLEVIFVPGGTFRLRGVITDPTTPSGPVKEARVQVLAGTGQGLGAFTGDDGQFVFFGVAGDVELGVTKEGYHTRSEGVRVDNHSTRNIELVRAAEIVDVSGTYTLRIAAAETCRTTLPEDAMVRTYSANVQQVGPSLTITVGNATFGTVNGRSANVIRGGHVFKNGVILSLGTLDCGGYYFGCGASVLEHLSPTRLYMPTGSAELQVVPMMLRGELDGAIETYEGDRVPGATRIASCKSNRHQITFTR